MRCLFRRARAAHRGFFSVWRQVFWQKRRVMRQKMVPSACYKVWQARTRRGRWYTRSAPYRVVGANAVVHHDASSAFPVQRRQELHQKVPLPFIPRAGKNAHHSCQTPRQLMRRRGFALCLLPQELTASGDRNSGGKTTLIRTINNCWRFSLPSIIRVILDYRVVCCLFLFVVFTPVVLSRRSDSFVEVKRPVFVSRLVLLFLALPCATLCPLPDAGGLISSRKLTKAWRFHVGHASTSFDTSRAKFQNACDC